MSSSRPSSAAALLSTRDVALAIEFQDNQLMGRFLDRAMQFFEYSD
jgi:hypothetical protein